MSTGSSLVVFIHIPKTAGTTLRTILAQQCLPHRFGTLYAHGRHAEDIRKLRSILDVRPDRYAIVSGHIGFGLHEYLPAACSYVTMLREPVARVRSMYEHICRSPTHPFHEDVARMSLSEYVRSEVDEAASDSQTRFLSSVKLTNQMAGDDDRVTCGGDPSAMLEEAKRNIDSRIAVTGLSERFDESLMLLALQFGWSRLYYSRLNTTSSGSGRSSISAAERAAIERSNGLDIELYDYAASKFRERVETSHVTPMLRRFQEHNRVWGGMYTYPTRTVQKLREYMGWA